MASSSAFGAARSRIQSKTRPRIAYAGIVGPVEKTIVCAVRIALPCRSEMPGSIVTEYAVFGRKSRRGLTSIRFRLQRARGRPALPGSFGETIKRFSRPLAALEPPPPPPPPGSLTTASKVNVTLRSRTFTAPESGVTLTIVGGVVRNGPPGGEPMFAQALKTMTHAAATPARARRAASDRTASVLCPGAAGAARSILQVCAVRPRRCPQALSR